MAIQAGTAGIDTLSGPGGNDRLTGLAGADLLVVGDGIGTANYDAATQGVGVDQLFNKGSAGDVLGDTLFGFEDVIGSAFAGQVLGVQRVIAGILPCTVEMVAADLAKDGCAMAAELLYDDGDRRLRVEQAEVGAALGEIELAIGSGGAADCSSLLVLCQCDNTAL